MWRPTWVFLPRSVSGQMQQGQTEKSVIPMCLKHSKIKVWVTPPGKPPYLLRIDS